MNAVIHLSRRFALPPDVLYALLTDPTAWWDEEASCTIDPQPGGALRSQHEAGVVKRVEPAQKLTIEMADETLLLLVLDASLDGTELTVLHSRFADGNARDDYLPRWEARLQRIGELATPE